MRRQFRIRKAVLEADIEEERRMFYVGMTRAKERLHLYYLKERYGKKQDIIPVPGSICCWAKPPVKKVPAFSRQEAANDSLPFTRRQKYWQMSNTTSASFHLCDLVLVGICVNQLVEFLNHPDSSSKASASSFRTRRRLSMLSRRGLAVDLLCETVDINFPVIVLAVLIKRKKGNVLFVMQPG